MFKKLVTPRTLLASIIALTSICIAYGITILYLLAPRETPSQEVESAITEILDEHSQIAAENKEPKAEEPKEDPNKLEVSDKTLFIPKIGLKVGIFSNGEKSLNHGMWNMFPERSDPEKGGNFVLSGHRFTIGFNPQGIYRDSPLINAGKLELGNDIIIVWKDKVFNYKIAKLYQVKPDDTHIEDNTNEDKLTIYTCGLGGEKSNRLVFEALPNAESQIE
jgi:sortase A